MRYLIIILSVLTFASCMSTMNETTEPHKESPSAKTANEFMWNNLHLGLYDSIPSLLEKLNSAYAENPKDPKITAHLAFVHLWTFSERLRKPAADSIGEHIFLSNYFFKKAIDLNPQDARLYGFQAATEMCQGAISKDPIMIATGYGKGIRAIEKWPQFNKFALSFVESLQDKNSPMFRQGMIYQWEVLDDCSCKKLTKKKILEDPEKQISALIDEVKNTSDRQIKRACGNSWIAPHNLEGFFLNMGDMLVKSGETETAKAIYNAARLAPSFDEWPYKHLIEERVRDAEKNEELFNEPLELIHIKNKKQIFINSEISCTGCHQMSPSEFVSFGYQEPKPDIYSTSK